MIIQIAFGIVLAVFILAFLREIFAFGLIAVLIVVGLVIGASAIFFLVTYPEVRLAALGGAIVVAAMTAIVYVQSQEHSKWRAAQRAISILAFGVAALLGGSLIVSGVILPLLVWGDSQILPMFACIGLVLVALGLVVVVTAYRRVFGS